MQSRRVCCLFVVCLLLDGGTDKRCTICICGRLVGQGQCVSGRFGKRKCKKSDARPHKVVIPPPGSGSKRLPNSSAQVSSSIDFQFTTSHHRCTYNPASSTTLCLGNRTFSNARPRQPKSQQNQLAAASSLPGHSNSSRRVTATPPS